MTAAGSDERAALRERAAEAIYNSQRSRVPGLRAWPDAPGWDRERAYERADAAIRHVLADGPTCSYRFGGFQVCTDGPLSDEEQEALREYFALVEATRGARSPK